MERLTGLVRRCVDDYNMIENGDKIAVGVSGGKDSLALLCSLASLRKYYPRRFDLSAITVSVGFPSMDFSGVEKLCKELDVPYTILKTGIKQVVFDDREEKNPCSLCVKMRKGSMNEELKRQGISKVALGHHYDDAVYTFFLSLFYEGRINCFSPVTYMDRTGITQIRPLLYTSEDMIRGIAAKYALPIVKNTCPMDGTSKRQEAADLVAELEKRYPELKSKVFGAMQRFPLSGWSPDHKPRQKSSRI